MTIYVMENDKFIKEGNQMANRPNSLMIAMFKQFRQKILHIN